MITFLKQRMKLLDYSDMIKILSLFLFLGFIYPAMTQEWPSIQQLGGSGNEECFALHITNEKHLYVAGSFQASMNFADVAVSANGDSDAFLAKYDEEGRPLWIRSGGGVLDDQITSITEDSNGNLICIGSYWLEAAFEDTTLVTNTSPKAILVLKYNPSGDLLWAKSIDGTTLKEATDLTVDVHNNIFITGFFEDQLILEDTTLQSVGESDLFILKLTPTGQMEWVYSDGYKGDTRAMSLALTSNDDLIIGGFYNDTTRLGDYELAANTADRDVFLLRMTQAGEVLWAKRAGGVHDDEIVGLALDESDHIYVTGYLVGVMNLSNQLSIQSGNGNSDFYLMQYHPDGQVLQARAMGGTQVQQTTDIQWVEDQVVISGYYFGSMIIDGNNLNAGGIVSGFVASFSTDDLSANWIISIDGDQTVVVNQARIDESGTPWIAGTFAGALLFENTFNSNGGFDLFFGPIQSPVTATKEEAGDTPILKVFPNPARTVLFVETNLNNYHVALINMKGQLIKSGKNLTRLNIENIPKGMYTVLVNNPEHHFIRKVIVE